MCEKNNKTMYIYVGHISSYENEFSTYFFLINLNERKRNVISAEIIVYTSVV